MITTRQLKDCKVEAAQDFLVITSGDFQLKIPFHSLSARLKNANEMERQIFSVSPSGYGIHWPLIDEDLAIEQIIRDFKA
jgi:hypothetical protein